MTHLHSAGLQCETKGQGHDARALELSGGRQETRGRDAKNKHVLRRNVDDGAEQRGRCTTSLAWRVARCVLRHRMPIKAQCLPLQQPSCGLNAPGARGPSPIDSVGQKLRWQKSMGPRCLGKRLATRHTPKRCLSNVLLFKLPNAAVTKHGIQTARNICCCQRPSAHIFTLTPAPASHLGSSATPNTCIDCQKNHTALQL